MKSILRKSTTPYGIIAAIACMMILFFGIIWVSQARADSPQLSAGERLITLHDRGQERGLLTHATTLREAFKEANIPVDPNDRVEPGLDEVLVANNYEVNVYRARPVTIVDGAVRKRVMSPYQTPDQIVAHASMTLHDEDTATLTASSDVVGQGTGVELKITRATPFTLVLYGKKVTAYTQEKTVGGMLQKKSIALGKNDTLSVPKTAKLKAGMVVELWRNGAQTVTEEQDIAFDTEQIQDADQPVGYKKIQTPGVPGKKTVTYEIVMKNGQEVSRKEIQNVTTKAPVKQVEVVGAKPDFSGDFAAALAKLRSCEGGYNSWNPAGPYYGAYQFNESAWNANAPAGAQYGNATPAEQDQAARNYYVKSGWRPWPNCGASLPDIYR